MATGLTDTSRDAQRVLNEKLRELPAWRKLEMVEDLITTSRGLALVGLRERYPQATEDELHRRLADMILGAELAERVYGPLNDDH